MTLSGVFCPEVAGPVHIPRRGLWLRSLAGETRVAPEACSHAGRPSPRRQPPGTALSVTGSREGVTAPPAERRMPRSPGPGDRPTLPSPAGGAGERAPPVGTVALLKGPSHGCWEPVASAPGPHAGLAEVGPSPPTWPKGAACPLSPMLPVRRVASPSPRRNVTGRGGGPAASPSTSAAAGSRRLSALGRDGDVSLERDEK